MSTVVPFRPQNGLIREVGLWGGAAVIAIAAHVGVAATILAFRTEPEAAGAPDTAIMVELAPVTTSVDAEQFDAPSEVAAEKIPDVPPEPIEEPELLEPIEPPPLDDWEEPVIELPEIETPVKPEVVLPVEKPKPEKPKEKPKKKEPEKKKVVKTRKPPSPVDSRLSATDAPRAERSASSEMSRSTVRSTSPATWHSRVAAHLSRRKPHGAGRGTVRVTLTVDANGNIISSSVSSGNSVLDRAAANMVRRANPVPAPPADLGVARQVFTVPVVFR